MKRLFFIFLLSGIALAGYAQDRIMNCITREKDTLNRHKIMRPIITDSFEKLDLNKYIKEGGRFEKKTDIDDGNGQVITYKDFEYSKHENDTLYLVTGSDNYSYVYKEMYDSSYFRLVKTYYPNRNVSIRAKFIEFIDRGNRTKIGKEYRFNENGILTQVIDHDENYTFLIEDAIDFAQKENIPLYHWLRNSNSYTEIRRTTYHNAPAWEVWWINPENTQITYILDGKTGDVLEKTAIENFFFEE